MTATPSNPSTFEQWARLELMGHRVRTGFVTEVEVFGGKMARIEVHEGETVIATEFYGSASIYGLTVMTREMVVERTKVVARPVALLGSPVDADFDEGDDDEQPF